MIKEIEQLQEHMRENANEYVDCYVPDPRQILIVGAVSTTLGLLHQLAVKVDRLERGIEPAPYVLDSEEGGM